MDKNDWPYEYKFRSVLIPKMKRILEKNQIKDINNQVIKEEQDENMNVNKDKKNRKIKTIYELIPEYTEEEINEVLRNLPEEDKYMIKLRYGDDLKSHVATDEWDDKYNSRFNPGIIRKIKLHLIKQSRNTSLKFDNKIESTREVIIPKEEDIVTKVDDDQKVIKPFDREKEIEMLKFLKTANFGEMLKVLTEKEAVIICLKLGYVDDKYFETEAIANFLGIEAEEVRDVTRKVLLLYKDEVNKMIDDAVLSLSESNKSYK